MNKIKITALVLALAAIFTIPALASTSLSASDVFTDVAGNFAEDEIMDFYTSGIIHGYPDGTFKPDANITRAEAAAIISRIGIGVPGTGTQKTFSDVPADSWFETYVKNISTTDYLPGADDKFNPGSSVDRLEGGVIAGDLSPATDISGVTLTYTDLGGLTSDQLDLIKKLDALGVISMFGDDTYGPTLPLTRSQFVMLLSQVTI